ncbi:MAG: hypothetical protein AAFY88_30290, partial [Acidobacteriota bacterium]
MHTSTTASKRSPKSTPRRRRASLLPALATAICALTAVTAQAQLAYSIEFQGPSVGLPAAAPAGAVVGAGDVLIPGAGAPSIVVFASTIGLAPGMQAEVEVDALSFGNDPKVSCDNNRPWLFS